jgi:hypothetical protein
MALTFSTTDVQNTTLATAITSGSISYTAGQPIVLLAGANTGTLTPSSSGGFTWTQIGSNTANTGQAAAWYTIPGSSGSSTFTMTGSAGWIGAMRVITHTGAGTPTNSFNGTTSTGGATVAQAITPTSSGSALWMITADNNANFNPEISPNGACSSTSLYFSSGAVCVQAISPTTNPLTSNSVFTIGGTAASLVSTSWVAFEVPSGGPGITAQPTEQAFTSGGTATFSVTASGGTAPLTYQWQSAPITSLYSNVPGTWANISGATSSSYTTGALTSANNGTWYRCVVTDSASQSVTSLAAQLVQSGVGAQGRGLLYGPNGWAQQSKLKNASGYQLLRRQMLLKDGLTTQRDVWSAWFFPSNNLTGSSATTDGADVSSASGSVSGGTVTGSSATTDGADTSAASGVITTTGSSATTDGADTSSASGSVSSGAITGSSATTDGADTSAASGVVTTTGSSATTDGADVSVALGAISTSGSSATTDGADVSAASGAITTSGSSATTDGADTSSASGAITTTGSSATTDGADTSSASGTVGNVANGTSATTDGADVSAAAGDVASIGTSASTDGADVSTASGAISASGSSATTDGPDVSAGSGSILAVIFGSAANADGFDVSTALGSVFDSSVTGSSATTDGADVSNGTDGIQSGGGGYDDDKPKKKKRYVVEVDGKIQVFASAQSANNALERAKPEEAQPKKVRKPVPVKTVKVDDLKDMAREREALDLVNQQLAQMQYEKLLRMYEDWQDEEDIEALLMAI